VTVRQRRLPGARTRRVTWIAWAAWGEAQAGDGGDLQGPDLDAAVGVLAGAVHDRICRHGSPASWACRARWLALTTSRSSAPRPMRKLAWSRWVSGASAVTTTPAGSRPASSGPTARSRWCLRTRRAGRAWPRRGGPTLPAGAPGGLQGPSRATSCRPPRACGGCSRSASHAPTVASTASPSTRAGTRRMVASPGTWQQRVTAHPDGRRRSRGRSGAAALRWWPADGSRSRACWPRWTRPRNPQTQGVLSDFEFEEQKRRILGS